MNDEMTKIKIDALDKQVEVLVKELKTANESISRLAFQNVQLEAKVKELENKLASIEFVSFTL